MIGRFAGKALGDCQRRLFGQGGDTIMSLLAMMDDMVPKLSQIRVGKFVIVDLDLLQADNIRLMFGDERIQLMETRADSVNIK